jgi:hypothetical protein
MNDKGIIFKIRIEVCREKVIKRHVPRIKMHLLILGS